MKCPKCHSDNPDTQQFCGDCGTQLTLPEDIQPSFTKTLETPNEELTRGALFADRYEIIEELGKGGMGKVYRAMDIEVKEEVALKLIKPEIAQDQATIERFRNELKVARKVSHRNVCRMHDLGKAEEGYYITMEYVEGENLKSCIRRLGKSAEGETISLAKQLCVGLKEAHELGVIHRDIKPQNIMVDKNGRAKIMDFGIARSLEAPGVTATGIMIGTPDYISPEQAEGEEADQRSDIYSLGVILYEMVTGRVPFRGDTAFSVALKHKSQIPKDPRKLNPEVSDDLSRLILICMEKDRKRRYQTARELLDDLRNIEEGFPLGTKIRPRRETFASTLLRNKLFIPAVAILTIVILGMIIWRLFLQKEGVPLVDPGRPFLAIMYFDNNTGDEGLDHWRKMLADLLNTDLTQSRFIKVLSSDSLYKILSKLNQLDVDTYSSDILDRVAEEGRVSHLLLGRYTRMGETFRIDAMLKDIKTGEILSPMRVEAQGEEEIFPKVDELTRMVKTNFELTQEQINQDIDEEIKNITTGSSEALKYYEEAAHYLRQAEYLKSVEFYEKAIGIDPEFALAYRDLAGVNSMIGHFDKYHEYIQKAFDLSHRISERERLFIQADFLRSEREYDRAIEIFNGLLSLYPDDWRGNNSLGIMYNNLGEIEKAVKHYKVNVDNRVEAVHSYSNLAYCYRRMGRYEEAVEVCHIYLNNFQHNNRIRWRLARTYIVQGKFDLAIAEANKFDSSYALFERHRTLGQIFMFMGDFIKSEEEYQKLLKLKEKFQRRRGRDGLKNLYRLQGRFEEAINQTKLCIELLRSLNEPILEAQRHGTLSGLYFAQGSWDDALKSCERELSVAREEKIVLRPYGPLGRKGRIYIKMGLFDEADKIGEELKGLLEKERDKRSMRYYYRLLGEREISKENFKEAIDMFEKAISLFLFKDSSTGQSPYFYSLGFAYYQMGDLDKARDQCDRITNLTLGRRSSGDDYAKSFYMLGKIHEQQGNTAKALEYYEKFLDLWKDADPGIPEVEDARKRLAGLKSQ